MRQMENLPGDNTYRKYTHHEHADVDYAATINLPVLEGVNEQDLYIAQLTGGATINLPAGSIVNLQKGDRVNIHVTADGTARTITWGTNIKSGLAATFAVRINGGITFKGTWDGTSLLLNV